MDLILLTGEARSRKIVSLEEKGVNVGSKTHKDNNNKTISSGILIENHKAEIISTFPYSLLEESLKDNNIEYFYSLDAGTYVCNSLLYLTLNYLEDKNIKCGFMHLPIIDDIDKYTKCINEFVEKLKLEKK